MNWMEKINGNPIEWLLEEDEHNPGIRYFSLLHILDRSPDDPEVIDARKAVMKTGPVPVILDAQHDDGYWEKPGPGYSPKYRGTVWQIILLGMFGADGEYPRVKSGCEYLLEHNLVENRSFSYNGKKAGLIHCLQGNLCSALIDLGSLKDERLLSSPLIMLDTNHDGNFENQFFQFLRNNHYDGFLFLDDIHLNDAMIRFWNSITEPKVDLTDIGHFSGSGLVDFSKKCVATGRPQFSSLAAVAG